MAASAKVRLSVCLNSGPRRGKPEAALLVAADTESILAAAANKLRLKKKDIGKARVYIWASGQELPRQGSASGLVRNDDLIAVTLGEAYLGPGREGCASGDVGEVVPTSHWLRWEERPAVGSFAVVEWSDARTMNATLGRMSTLLEHPTLCGAESGRLVGHEEQRILPSSSYLGHNLYSQTLLEFERLAEGTDGAGASAAENDFVQLWRSRGAPEVIVSFVTGETATLRHELCHARFALDEPYRAALMAAWELWEPSLGRWMRDLGYHRDRHADEFGAYVLTEPSTFWRGRIGPEDLKALRTRLTVGDTDLPDASAPSKGAEVGRVSRLGLTELQVSVPKLEWSHPGG